MRNWIATCAWVFVTASASLAQQPDDDGRASPTCSRISAISGDEITVFTEGSTPFLPMIHPARTYAFAADSVTRIEVVDSTANGVLIGAAVGARLMYGLVETNKDKLANNLARGTLRSTNANLERLGSRCRPFSGGAAPVS